MTQNTAGLPKPSGYETGMTLRAPAPRGEVHAIPQWRLGVFTVILPIPENAISPAATDDDGFLRVPSDWAEGRFGGIGVLEIPSNAPEPRILQLQVFDTRASQRFGPLIGRAVDGEPVESEHAGDRSARTRLRHVVLDPGEEANGFEIIEDGGTGDARISLQCIELLQYWEADADPDRQLINRFLVLHLVVENCTSATFEAVSQASHRPRGFVRVRRPESVAPFVKDPHSDRRDDLHPLRYYTEKIAVPLLQAALPEGGPDLTMTKGGFLMARSQGTSQRTAAAGAKGERSVGEGLEARAAGQASVEQPAGDGRRRSYAPPHRIVLAVPGDEVGAAPALMNRDPRSAWSDVEKWAWMLATGADEYVEALPAQTESRALRAHCGEYQSWTLWASEFGLAVVRHRVGEPEDGVRLGETTFMRLPQTVYTDLALLNLRCYQELSVFAADLSLIDSRAEQRALRQRQRTDEADREERESPAQSAKRRLEHQLQLLEALQNDFVVFRDKLWFRHVPRHRVDTRILLTLRETCGVGPMLDEFVEELTLRREVYSTQYAALEISESREREEQWRREELARDDERSRREGRAEQLNQILAVAAVVLATPAIVESTGTWSSWEALGWVLATMLVLGLITWVLVRWWMGRERRKDERKRSRPAPSPTVRP